MATPKVFIDGHAGTTGLRIHEMLGSRNDIELLTIPQDDRKDPAARSDFLNRADVAILCLPDDAVPEALEMVEGGRTRIIDVSTKRRVHPDWVYGLPELCSEQRDAIRRSARVANPGCYPTGFILSIRPLVDMGVLEPDAPLTMHGYSGYSGGGRKMIESYHQASENDDGIDSAWPISLYALNGGHKHLAEMACYAGLPSPPVFVPCVGHYHCGMLDSIPLPASMLRPGTSTQDVWDILHRRYDGEPFVRVMPLGDTSLLRDGKFMEPQSCNQTNRIDLYVFGEVGYGIVLVSCFDNLGKGASGNAVQCLNIMLRLEETAGLQAFLP
jgi:N-acetyl-gamma-glutamyl-phosphate reductase